MRDIRCKKHESFWLEDADLGLLVSSMRDSNEKLVKIWTEKAGSGSGSGSNFRQGPVLIARELLEDVNKALSANGINTFPPGIEKQIV